MYRQIIKITLFTLFFLVAKAQGEPLESIVEGVKFELRSYGNVLIENDYEGKKVVGLNNLGQALFYENDHLIFWDSHQGTSTNLSKLIDQDLFIYCPYDSQCLNDAGEVIGLVDLAVVRWSETNGLSFYPLPEELCKENWEHFYAQKMEYLSDGRILLKFGGFYSESKYYILDNGEFIQLNTYLEMHVLGKFSSYSISDLRLNKQGHMTGVLNPYYYSDSGDKVIFTWDGSSAHFMNLKDIIKRKNHTPETCNILSFLENGDVMLYFDDYKSLHTSYTIYRYVMWNPESGKVEEVMNDKEYSPNSFNSKGNGVFLKDDNNYYALYNGILHNLNDIFEGLKLGWTEYYDPYWDEYDDDYFDVFLKINENDEILIEGTSLSENRPVLISLSPA